MDIVCFVIDQENENKLGMKIQKTYNMYGEKRCTTVKKTVIQIHIRDNKSFIHFDLHHTKLISDWCLEIQLQLGKNNNNLLYHTADGIFFILMLRRVFEDSEQTSKTVVNVIK